MDKTAENTQSTRTSKKDRHKENQNEPTAIGSYKIDRTLGQGTYGKVKLGIHVSTNEKVAIKIIEKANIQSQRQVARIQREIRFLKLLHHPHIVKVYEVHETNEQIFIVMEHVKGGELFDYIVSHKRVKEKEARAFYRQVLSALHYCHANSVIHRDLKPENLLLDDENGQKTIKIIDFGFGNTFKPSGLLDTFCGSPFYAAPEMILGKRYEGPEVDMWSIGVILFALLCGHLPFDDENIKELYRKIASGSFTCPSYLTSNAKHLIQRMITVDPKKRATLEEVMNHPWVNEGYSSCPYSYLSERPVIRDASLLSTDIIGRLQAFGYTQDEIVKAFAEEDHSKPHPIRSTYFLLSEMLLRVEKRNQGNSKRSSLTSPPPTASASLALLPESVPSASDTLAEATSTSTQPQSISPEAQPAPAVNLQPLSVTQPDRNVEEAGVSGSSGAAPTASPIAGAANLYIISEDEVHDEPSQVVNAGTTITAKKKGEFISMPQVAHVDAGKRRSSTTEAEVYNAVKPGDGRLNSGNRPRHSTNSLQSDSGRVVRQAAPPARAPNSPQSAGPTQTSSPADNQRGPSPTTWSNQGRRFSLAALTSGSKRRSSTSPSQQVPINAVPATPTSPTHSESQSKKSSDNSNRTSISSDPSTASARSVNSWFLSVETTSAKLPKDIALEVKRVLAENDVQCTSEYGFVIECKTLEIVFEIEICKVPRLDLYGLHFKRISGGLWAYKKICNKLLGQMNL